MLEQVGLQIVVITEADACKGFSVQNRGVCPLVYFVLFPVVGIPARTWYFSTDANGVVDYRSSSLASGYASDALYINTDGYNQIPLGTVKITEICNSLGYTVLPDSLYCSISADPSSASGASVAWTTDSWTYLMNMTTGNYGIYEPIDTSKFGSLTIQKADRGNGSTAPGWASFAGCEFTVYNRSTNAVKIGDAIIQPGGVCCVLTVGSDGKASTGSIFPVGIYEVKETKGNEYYIKNQLQEDQIADQMSIKEYVDPFTGRENK